MREQLSWTLFYFVFSLFCVLRPSSTLKLHMNTTSNAVCLEDTYDGSYNKWCLLFSKGLQLWKNIVLGEADLAQPIYYSICFVDLLNEEKYKSMKNIFDTKKELITYESKESADVDLGMQQNIMKGLVDATEFKAKESEIMELCSGQKDVYISMPLINRISSGSKAPNSKLQRLPTRNDSAYPLCEEAVVMWELGCICKRSICFPWFPCAVKSCPPDRDVNVDSQADCETSGCKKCDVFEFFVPRKDICFWNIQS